MGLPGVSGTEQQELTYFSLAGRCPWMGRGSPGDDITDPVLPAALHDLYGEI